MARYKWRWGGIDGEEHIIMPMTQHELARRDGRRPIWLALVLLTTAAPAARASDQQGEGGLRPGDYVAVVGDSITEQKQYSVFIEDYLLMCKPAPDLRVSQFGWSGDTSWGLAGRMENDLLRFKPTVATTCFGMNDGGYSPMNEEYQKHVPEESEALDRIAAALMKKHRPMVDASAAAVKPVRHVIRIDAAKSQAAKSQAAKSPAPNPPTMKASAGTPDNTPPEGFIAAFNGRDLTGWKGLMKSPLDNPYNRAKLSPEAAEEAQAEADEDMRKHWKAEDGALVFDGKGRSLVVAKDYGDFELWVDWKIKEKGDSGIYVRGTPQIQIWDPFNDPKNAVGSGGLFNNKNNPSKPLKRADKPIGEWNTFFIRMVGDRVTVFLNGELVVDNTPLENYWSRASKLGDLPLFPTGQIELQNHGNTLWFKNIYIRELPAGPGGSVSPAKT